MLFIARSEKLMSSLTVDDALVIRPGPEWCLVHTPVQECDERGAQSRNFAVDGCSIRGNIKAESHEGTSQKLTSQKLTIENLLFNSLGQVLIHIVMGYNPEKSDSI